MSGKKYMPTEADLKTLEAMKAGFEITFQQMVENVVLSEPDKTAIANRIKKQVTPLVKKFDAALLAFEKSLEEIRKETERLEKSTRRSVQRKSSPAAERLSDLKNGLAETFETGTGLSPDVSVMFKKGMERKACVAETSIEDVKNKAVLEIMKKSGLTSLGERRGAIKLNPSS